MKNNFCLLFWDWEKTWRNPLFNFDFCYNQIMTTGDFNTQLVLDHPDTMALKEATSYHM